MATLLNTLTRSASAAAEHPAPGSAAEHPATLYAGALLTAMNPKLLKGEAYGFASAVLHLSPATAAGIESAPGRLWTTCAKATLACAHACLNESGRAGIFVAGETTNPIQEARKARTRLFYFARRVFITRLKKEIRAHVRRARKAGMTPAVRLNGTSDIQWERVAPEIFAEFPDVQFYDYTKISARFTRGTLPPNYHLTFSYSDAPESAAEAREVLNAGGCVAVVFRSKETRARYMESGWQGARVIDGDETDLRFTDPAGVVVGLYAKGRKAKRDASGFVVD